ncbi:MAG: helix-turn-helix domain-containing protein, partial [Chloroflexi bacterium]|nr:helix-turn-helix domain-containing protein [Chloroflexota bacterium]
MVRGVPPDYSSRIKMLRARLGLTQRRLAELMGVSFASVNRWENGLSRPSALAWQQVVQSEQSGIDVLQGGPGVRVAVRETGEGYAVEPESRPEMDFTSDPEIVRAVVEGQRLSYGHLFNPAFATETSLIDPLPHQRIAVYGRMLGQPRLRFLLADDAGAGKTIMTGLYVREMMARRLIRRVLIVPPAGLVGNWERELRTLFSLPFTIVTGADARAGNPFAGDGSDLAIVSVDTLAGERAFSRLREPSVEPYDLVVFDEAHKLSADREPDFRVRKTGRYRLAEALAGAPGGDERWQLGWACNHLLLLTATPHQGKDYPYYALWRLLEPEALSTPDAFNAYPTDARHRHFLRRTKEEMVYFDGSPMYPKRVSDTLSYDLTQGPSSEQALYDATTSYIQGYYNLARILNRSAVRLAMSVFQRRLASSTYALLSSLERRMEKLEGLIEGIRSGRITLEQLAAMQRRLDGLNDVLDRTTADEESAEEGQEENERFQDEAVGGMVVTSLAQLEAERLQVRGIMDLARRVYEQGEESKFEKLREILRDPVYRDQKLIVFTEHRDTLTFLVRRLEGLGFAGQIARIHGGMDYAERDEQEAFFRKPIAEGGASLLVATDAAGEGRNLQFCWLMANYDVPWNPARLEQRMGRIHRYLQKHDPVVILNLVAGKTREGRVLRTLLEKLERIRRELGSDKVFDVVGRLFEGVSLKDYMEQAVTEEGAKDAERKIEGKLTKEQVEALAERERRLFGDGGDVKVALPELRRQVAGEELLRL